MQPDDAEAVVVKSKRSCGVVADPHVGRRHYVRSFQWFSKRTSPPPLLVLRIVNWNPTVTSDESAKPASESALTCKPVNGWRKAVQMRHLHPPPTTDRG